ncbi:MAG: hypothetical protein CFE46_17315 [Burkholderiales bacterium PBB6]|nr:MAG: hypothetical protein CFE46_17315 [Burkholderiales bacterium PBB6]
MCWRKPAVWGSGDNHRMPELSSDTPAAAASAHIAPRRPWWQRPFGLSLLFTLSLLVAAGLWAGWLVQSAPPGPSSAEMAVDLPWQVLPQADGSSRVFGLQVGRSSLADVEQRLGDELRTGLIAPHGQPPALESFVDGFRAGFVTGRLVLAFEADADWLAQARERSPRQDVGEGGRSRRYALAADDLPAARQRRLVGVVFLPSARLDEATLVQRFGTPSRRLATADGVVQLLYPEKGVAVAVPPAEGPEARARAVIQYSAPADFERRLLAPLLAELAGQAASQPSTGAPIAR